MVESGEAEEEREAAWKTTRLLRPEFGELKGEFGELPYLGDWRAMNRTGPQETGDLHDWTAELNPVGKPLGEGADGQVVEGTCVPGCGNWTVAVKVVPRKHEQGKEEWLQSVRGEVAAQRLEESPLFVRHFDSGTYIVDGEIVGFCIVRRARAVRGGAAVWVVCGAGPFCESSALPYGSVYIVCAKSMVEKHGCARGVGMWAERQ